MFANDRKKFFRNLGKDQISVEKPPKKDATETFWRNILENDREHNHSAEWIKREEQKYADRDDFHGSNIIYILDSAFTLSYHSIY